MRLSFVTILVLGILVFLSFGLSTGFDLWQDDNALIFKLQHIDEAAGVFGPGPLGLGAYRYIVVPYIPLYRLFGFETRMFYLLVLFFYFLASIAVFIFTKRATKNSFLGAAAAAIFASGYIGSDGILRLFNGVQTSYSIILSLLTFLLLYQYFETKRLRFLFVSFITFFITLETGYVRTFYLIIPIFTIIILYSRSLIKFLPFGFIYYWIYLRSPDPRGLLIKDFFTGIFLGELEYLHGFFASLGNIVIPQPISSLFLSWVRFISLDPNNQALVLQLILLFLFSLFNLVCFKKERRFVKVMVLVFSGVLFFMFWGRFVDYVGAIFILFALSTIFRVRKDKGDSWKFLLFTFIFIVSSILTYTIYLPKEELGSIHRYLTHSAAAYAIFVTASFFWLFKSKKPVFLFVLILVLINVTLSRKHQSVFYENITIPTQDFYLSLKNYLPEIKKGSLIYFDVAEDATSQQRFKDFFSVGSMPDSTAIAVRYKIDRYDFVMTTDFDEFLKILNENNVSLGNSYSYFYSTKGLIDTSRIMRRNLSGEGESTDFLKVQSSTSVTPVNVKFLAEASLPEYNPLEEKCLDSISLEDRKLSFDYLHSKSEIRDNMNIIVDSEDKHRYKNMLIDGDLETIWKGNRGWWIENKSESIILNLGSRKLVNQLIWVNGYKNNSPTVYRIETSTDGVLWDVVKEVNSPVAKESGTMVVENFDSHLARMVKLVITDTFDKDSPTISEIELVEGGFSEVDKDKAYKFLLNPFYCATTYEEKRISTVHAKIFGVKPIINYKTDKSNEWKELRKVILLVKSDIIPREYEFTLPASGTKIEGLDIKLSGGKNPIKLHISSIKLSHPDIKELERN